MTIQEILDAQNINGFDKPGGTDKNTIHSYVETYEKYLSPYINKECSLLEIGVWHGGSSLLWQEYLPRTKLHCVDIDDLIDESIKTRLNERFHFYKMNAYTHYSVSRLLNDVPDGFDIIIEDGIHTEESNKFVIEHYLPMLRKGGIMVIEDLPINSQIEIPFGYSLKYPDMIKDLIDSIPNYYEVEVIDLTHAKGRFDDILMIIKRL